jgi:hypothetical protein
MGNLYQSRFTPRKVTLIPTEWKARWGSRAGLDFFETRKMYCPCTDSNHGLSRPLCSHSTDYFMEALIIFRILIKFYVYFHPDSTALLLITKFYHCVNANRINSVEFFKYLLLIQQPTGQVQGDDNNNSEQ